MRRTVGQRIAAGYAVILLLLVIVAGVGMFTLSRTADTFRTAIVQLERDLSNALEAETAFGAPNVDFLRFLATGDEDFLKRYEKGMTRARQILAELERKSLNKEVRDDWGKAYRLLAAWDDKAKRAT